MSLRVIKRKVLILVRRFSDLWGEARLFSFNNRTLVETLFLVLYTLEQSLLILFTELFAISKTVVTSYFALIVLFTFSIHKTSMESRIRLLENRIEKLKIENLLLKQKVVEVGDECMVVRKETEKRVCA